MCLPLTTYAIKRLVININAIVYTFHNTNLQYRCEKIDDIYIYIKDCKETDNLRWRRNI